MGLCCRSPWLTWDTVNGVDFSKILREQRLVITDESIGVSQLLGVHMPGLPSKVYAYGHHILDVGHWLMWAYASILGAWGWDWRVVGLHEILLYILQCTGFSDENSFQKG